MSRPSIEDDAPSAVPRRRSRVPYLFVLSAGVLIGRIASEQFPSGPLNALDLVMYVGLAFSIAWAWRSWARGAMEQRTLAARRRAARGGRAPSNDRSDAATDPDEMRAGPDRAPRTRRRRR
jgi:hypothetical protein